MSSQVEVGVTGQVYDSGLSRYGVHVYLQSAIIEEVERHGNYDVSWVTLVSVLGE